MSTAAMFVRPAAEQRNGACPRPRMPGAARKVRPESRNRWNGEAEFTYIYRGMPAKLTVSGATNNCQLKRFPTSGILNAVRMFR